MGTSNGDINMQIRSHFLGLSTKIGSILVQTITSQIMNAYLHQAQSLYIIGKPTGKHNMQ
jgi:hypothetical protein